MKTVHEVSELTGVSVRTLHHYDAIGLLKPAKVTDAGYRLYDSAALARLQTILLFRELQFPLADIRRMIDSPHFDEKAALSQQITLLELRQKHLGELIAFARQIEKTGVNTMDFSAFDKTEIEQYAAEAKKRWGDTAAYKEYEKKAEGQSAADQQSAVDGLMGLFAAMGNIRHLAPDSDEAQAAIADLRQFITANFYTCTPPILRGLGQMYAAGGSMTDNIDKAGGSGTAAFAAAAINVYCDRQNS